ncbi:unnamed protein product [Adineta steineri]|uniref:Uncharacterized protein n=1 Tax=Adineta steineri TaxID=433720 RepID=A0A814H2I8_9BILA|nr:unnamed protein product [Adineta steineri]CAF1004459.1 unnamed protein product [Adineta steineri]CAF3531858.1 unnamed protein product [Adineta steineri]CAF3597226.1 unnamed protein product [Adineta steineri]
MQTTDNSSDLLDSLKCPITYEFFRDPVIGSDGHTYERENIVAWIKQHGSSPITREPMDLNSLRSNYIVKKMVEEFLSLSSQKQYRFRLDIDICKTKPRPIFQSPGKTIYEAKWMMKHGPDIVLIKIDGAKANREASFYVKLSCHPHIVRTYGLVDSNSSDSIMLVQEYASEGDLSELLRSNNFQPTLEVLIEIFRQIVDAMICLADNQIIHGDLACRNVLVFRSSPTQSTEILVKLTDFGLTRTSSLFSVIDSPASATLKMIPVRYAAPELLLDASSSNYSEKSDIYSFGVLMWEACSNGAVPYGDIKSTDTVYQEKLNGKLLERPSICPNELWNLIVHCIQQQPNERPSFKDIQDILLELRFENKRDSSNRFSQIHPISFEKQINKTLPINNTGEETHYQWYNEECFSKNNDNEKQDHFPIYENLDDNSTKYGVSNETNTNTPSSDYYIPCQYCLQSISNDGFDMHKNVCIIRRLILQFVQMVIQLPFVDITSCEYCQYIIPLNMLNIHQNTCGENSINLHNPIQSPQHLQSSMNIYVNSAHLKPVSRPNSKIEENVYANMIMPDELIKNLISNSSTQLETSNQSPTQHESTIATEQKHAKSGFRKAFSSFKKKML